MKTKISIILPVYNAERYLSRCVDSILNQTFQEFELIIIDDGSKDNSSKMCDEYASRDNRVRVIHKQNGGVASARQRGIEEAKGVYSIHADSDDWIESDMLQSMYETAIKNNADIVIADYYKDKNQHQEYIHQRFEDGNARDALLGMCQNRVLGAMWHKLIRHSLYKKYGIKFIEGINYCEDLLVMSKFLVHSVNVIKLDKAFYHYNADNEGSLTKDSALYVSSILNYFDQQKVVTPESGFRKEYYCILLDIIQNCFRKGFVNQEYFVKHNHSTWTDIKESNVKSTFRLILLISHFTNYNFGKQIFKICKMFH